VYVSKKHANVLFFTLTLEVNPCLRLLKTHDFAWLWCPTFQRALDVRSFFCVWNSFINSLREEDFISDRLELWPFLYIICHSPAKSYIPCFSERRTYWWLHHLQIIYLLFRGLLSSLLARCVIGIFVQIWIVKCLLLLLQRCSCPSEYTRYPQLSIWPWLPKRGMSMSWSKKSN
jgi:hypothetical protein